MVHYLWDIQVPYIMIKITVMFQNLTYVPFFNLHYLCFSRSPVLKRSRIHRFPVGWSLFERQLGTLGRCGCGRILRDVMFDEAVTVILYIYCNLFYIILYIIYIYYTYYYIYIVCMYIIIYILRSNILLHRILLYYIILFILYYITLDFI